MLLYVKAPAECLNRAPRCVDTFIIRRLLCCFSVTVDKVLFCLAYNTSHTRREARRTNKNARGALSCTAARALRIVTT